MRIAGKRIGLITAAGVLIAGLSVLAAPALAAAPSAPLTVPTTDIAPHRVTLTATLVRDPQSGAVRLGVRHATDARPFVAVYGMSGPNGALVLETVPGGAAVAAGMLPGDMIVKLGTRDVARGSEFTAMVVASMPGPMPIEVIRIGRGTDDALAYLRARATAGDGAAYVALGDMSYHGLRGQTDNAEAFRLYRSGAELGNPLAAFRAGFMYANGIGTTADMAAATRWYRTAADAQIADAIYALGALNWAGRYWNGSAEVGNDVEAVRLFRAAADAGYINSYLLIGIAYQAGRGLPMDLAEARRWYEKGAAAGDAAATSNLALLYLDATGVPMDYTRARQLFEQAAALGEAFSKRKLGEIYREGKGVPADRVRALGYFREAAAANDVPAMYALGAVLGNGTDIAERREAASWFAKASAAGSAEADYALALIAIGVIAPAGTPPDYPRAAASFVQAVERGSTQAIATLKTSASAATWPQPAIAAIQQRLADKGVYAGATDGRVNPATLAAIDALAPKMP